MRRIHRGEKGFTLIEILIVIGILAILATVAVFAAPQILGTAETAAQAVELDTVQAAIDAMMAQNGLSSLGATNLVDTAGERTQTMTAFPYSTGNDTYDLSNYLRTSTTRYWYYTSTTGLVTQDTTGP